MHRPFPKLDGSTRKEELSKEVPISLKLEKSDHVSDLKLSWLQKYLESRLNEIWHKKQGPKNLKPSLSPPNSRKLQNFPISRKKYTAPVHIRI